MKLAPLEEQAELVRQSPETSASTPSSPGIPVSMVSLIAHHCNPSLQLFARAGFIGPVYLETSNDRQMCLLLRKPIEGFHCEVYAH